MQEYADWQPQDYEDYYISPGLVDLNVQTNGPWEGLEETTKMGVAGGVTFMLVERSHYGLHEELTPLYCDIGQTLVVDETKGLGPDFPPGIHALKVYLTPPSPYVQGSIDYIEPALSMAAACQLPLLVDPIVGTARLMYMASPCRFSSLEERSQTTDFPDDKVFAGAFPEDLSPNSNSESEEEPEKPLFSRGVSQEDLGTAMEQWRLQVPSKSVEISENIEELISNPEKIHSTAKLSQRRKSANLKTIYDDLRSRIKAMEHSIEDLSRVEQLAYKNAGETRFALTRQRSKSLTGDNSNDLPVRVEAGKRRPRPLSMKGGVPKAGKDRVYLQHLANHPDHWESNGIETVLSILAAKRPNCRVHFCNVSSASAIHRIERRQFDSTLVSVETCPNFLYFTALSVQDGDTRLKSNPPIRNKLNCNLLWELLKMGKIEVLSSHHQPICPQYKYLDSGSFKQALPGISSLGASLQAVWTRLRAPMVQTQSSDSYIMRLAKWTATCPATILGIAAERGSISVGKLADLVIWDPEAEVQIQAGGRFPEISPYHGAKMRGKIAKVYVRGALAYEEGHCYQVGALRTRATLRS